MTRMDELVLGEGPIPLRSCHSPRSPWFFTQRATRSQDWPLTYKITEGYAKLVHSCGQDLRSRNPNPPVVFSAVVVRGRYPAGRTPHHQPLAGSGGRCPPFFGPDFSPHRALPSPRAIPVSLPEPPYF